MQERYAGDVHDFLKFALLRHLGSTLDTRVGVNWYRTDPAAVDRRGSGDGEQRGYLRDPRWEGLDDPLRARLAALQATRSLKAIEKSGVLPRGTPFFGEPVPCEDRAGWQARARAALEQTGLVFLDPDNGFEVATMRRRTAPKYALYSEAAGWVEAGKAVATIQFARQCDPAKRAEEVRERLMDGLPGLVRLPVVRCAVAPTILFVSAAPVDRADALDAALRAFAKRCVRLSLVEVDGDPPRDALLRAMVAEALADLRAPLSLDDAMAQLKAARIERRRHDRS